MARDSLNDVALGSSEMEKFLCELLLDSSQPISERFRALFSLRNLKGPAPRHALILATRDSSNLLAHEAAFALGQMQELEAVPALASVLKDLSLHRHEAAEALGAIGSDDNVPLLKSSLDSDPAQEVRETCELALQRIQHLKDAGKYFLMKKRRCMNAMQLFLHFEMMVGMKPLMLLLIPWFQKVLYCAMRLHMFWVNCKTKLLQLLYPIFLNM